MSRKQNIQIGSMYINVLRLLYFQLGHFVSSKRLGHIMTCTALVTQALAARDAFDNSVSRTLSKIALHVE